MPTISFIILSLLPKLPRVHTVTVTLAHSFVLQLTHCATEPSSEPNVAAYNDLPQRTYIGRTLWQMLVRLRRHYSSCCVTPSVACNYIRQQCLMSGPRLCLEPLSKSPRALSFLLSFLVSSSPSISSQQSTPEMMARLEVDDGQTGSAPS